MRKHLRLVALIIPMVLVASNSYAAVKAGSSCSKAGIKSVSAGKTYTCVKNGKKLVWDKGVLIPVAKPAPSASASASAEPTKSAVPEVLKVDFSKTFSTDQGYYTDFTGPCDLDENLKGQAAAIQSYFNYIRCAGQMRINKYALGQLRPKTSYIAASNFNNVDPCKLVTPKGVMTNNGFTTAEDGRNRWANNRRYPAPNAVIQLIPIYAKDTEQPKNSPEEDYKFYLDYLKNWIDYSSDFGSNVQIRIPRNYIKLNGNVADYHLLHTQRYDTPGHVAFNKDVVSAVDSSIDFTGVNIAIVVPPAGTDATVMGQATLGEMITNEGSVYVTMSEYATDAGYPNRDKYSNAGHPFWWLHELMHSGYGLDDHYGDTQNDISTEYGMGWLTLMTPFGGDLTTWEKWILGFLRDSQIQCVTGVTSSTHWIAPSSVNTQESKAIVVPLSATKAIVIETIRAAGLYYKMPKQSQGALVYELDLMKSSHGMGMKLSLPIGRTVTNDPFFMASYPLKQGESTICDGYKITIVESGTFGDVVKVEKV
jgi:M6 family metalloprotease-like protein